MRYQNKRIKGSCRMLLCIAMVSMLFSCSLYKALNMKTYDDFAEVANSFWVNLYLNFHDIEMLDEGDVMYKNTTWKKKHSPIILDKNLNIFPGVTLKIEPGVKVMFAEEAKITCQGLIKAKGTPDAPITFTWKDEGRHWNLIECLNSVGGSSDGPGTIEFEHCIVEYGRGIKINSSDLSVRNCVLRHHLSSALKIEYASGLIENNVIYGNTTELEAEGGNGGGIKVFTNLAVNVTKNEVYGNVSAGGRDGGGGIYAFAYDNGSVTVTENIVRNNTSDRKGGGIFAYDALVKNNTVEGNTSAMTGGGIYALQAVVQDNVVRKNTADEGGGVFSNNAEIIHNLVRDNRAPKGSGIFHLGAGTIEKNSFVGNAGPGDSSDAVMILLGNAIVRHNNIVAHKGYALDFQSHNLSPDLVAERNYWGTDQGSMIETLVCDWMEDSRVGLVSWKKFASKPVADAYPIPADAEHRSTPDLNPLKPGEVRGIIEADTTWGDGEITTYSVVGNLLIREGKTLTLLPGTTLLLNQDVSIRVRGLVSAPGNEQRPVRFSGREDQPWAQLLFENRSLDEKTQVRDAGQKSRLEHCLIENGSGVVMDGKGADLVNCRIINQKATGVRIKEVSVTVKGCVISGNISDSDGGGIYAYGSCPIDIHDNIITDNQAKDGGGIFAYGYQSNVAVDMRNNRIEGNVSFGDGGGIWASRSAVVGNRIIGNKAAYRGGGLYAGFALVNDNRIQANTAEEGGGVYGESNSALTGNFISDNTSLAGMGGGVYLNYWGMSMHNKIFENNRVEGNTTPRKAGTGGVCLSGALSFSRNAIFNNTGIQLNNLNPSDNGVLEAKDCFWGTLDLIKIGESIRDGKDDPAFSVVKYAPVARTASEISQDRDEPRSNP